MWEEILSCGTERALDVLNAHFVRDYEARRNAERVQHQENGVEQERSDGGRVALPRERNGAVRSQVVGEDERDYFVQRIRREIARDLRRSHHLSRFRYQVWSKVKIECRREEFLSVFGTLPALRRRGKGFSFELFGAAGQEALTAILGADWDAVEDTDNLVDCVYLKPGYEEQPIYGKFYVRTFQCCQRNEQNERCVRRYQVGHLLLRFKRTHYYRR